MGLKVIPNLNFEYIALYMEEKEINIYLIQQIWLEEDIDHWNINGITFFMYAPEYQKSSRERGGLAIELLKKPY